MSAPPGPPQSNPPPTVDFEAEREVRFAVVMYGGVSLAIYINGVTQELLAMVRATAPGKPDSPKALLNAAELEGAMPVYRKLGQYLGASDDEKAEIRRNVEATCNLPIRTRFVVDVISGTSAGGINGVFLGKALALNQNLNGLKKLWLSEGDLAKLLNDQGSVSDLRQVGFDLKTPQASLLNSQRMYRKLLEAFDQMEKSTASPEVSPLVGELDLFVTTTDIEGVALPLKLQDKVVFERRHRNVFHFRYATAAATGFDRNDFVRANDPFLAYASRCTSSFPFAFEPMRLCDIQWVAENYADPGHAYRSVDLNSEAWDPFFSEYLRPPLLDWQRAARGESAPRSGTTANPADTLRKAFAMRSFGDGGYLDNKPFTHATSMLMRRHSEVAVERKLIYIEPSPEHPELLPTSGRTPDFIENSMAALLDLPRQETIREDIERLMERNAMIDRVSAFARNVDDDLTHLGEESKSAAAEMTTVEFQESYLEKMIQRHGAGYGAYHRLKVEETTGLLSDLMARAGGYDQRSDAPIVVHALAEAWRRRNYCEFTSSSAPAGVKLKSENAFLVRFDLRYAIRRLTFINRRVNELSRVSTHADDRTVDDAESQKACALFESWVRRLPKEVQPVFQGKLSKGWAKAFVRELNRIRREILGPALLRTRTCEEHLLRSETEVRQERQRLNISEERFAELLQKSPGQRSDDDKKQTLDPVGKSPSLEKLAALEGLLNNADFRSEVGRLMKEWPEFPQILNAFPETRLQYLNDLRRQHPERRGLDPLFEIVYRSFTLVKTWQAASDDDQRLLKDPAALQKFPDLEGAIGTEDRAQAQAALAARLCVEHYRREFLSYDLVVYPILSGSGVGEANRVEVYRISPEDAVGMIDERKPGETRRKLAGTTLMNFGAFLEQAWRRNDILWGRLDGAERLICAVLPNPADADFRKALIEQAQRAILCEEVNVEDLNQLRKILGESLIRTEPRFQTESELRATVLRVLATTPLSQAVRATMQAVLSDEKKLWDYYRESFEVDRRPDPENALLLISRATHVTGSILEGLAKKAKLDPAQRASAWISKLGSVFWKMVVVAVPGSLSNLFVKHWLGVFYVLSFVLILGGVAINATVVKFGWQLLGLTVAVTALITGLGDYISGRWRWLAVIRTIVAVLLISLLGFGVYFVANRLKVESGTSQFLAWAIAGVFMLAVALLEWRRLVKQSRDDRRRVNAQQLTLFFTFTTLAAGLFLRWLGPPEVVRFELAQTTKVAEAILEHSDAALWERQLRADFFFILTYVSLLVASATLAARAWGSSLREKIDGTPVNDDAGRENVLFLQSALRWTNGGATTIALLACFAGGCDALENIGLLSWLHHRSSEFWLKFAFIFSVTKFISVTVAFLGAAFGLFACGLILPQRLANLWIFLPLAILLSFGALSSVLALHQFWP